MCSQGEFAVGKRHGFGKLTNYRGDVYEGQWYEGMPHGEGKCYYAGFFFCAGQLYEGMPRDKSNAFAPVCSRENTFQ